MKNFTFNLLVCPFILLSCLCCSVMSLWDFSVSTERHINFYDNKWSLITAVHQFANPSSLYFDETEEKIYFNDKNHKNVSIFSLKIMLDEIIDGSTGIESTERIVKHIYNETINAIAYDPLDRILYWTDGENRKIYTIPISSNSNAVPKILIDFSKENNSYPDGISLDICNRKLYWTNSNHNGATIERSSLNGSDREIIQNEHLYLPHGIMVDQFTHRIFWVVDQHGSHYSIESSNLNGSERIIHAKQLHNKPQHITVTHDTIYWTDLTHNSVWNISKNANTTNGHQPQIVLTLTTPPTGLVSRQEYITHLENDQHCKDMLKTIKERLLKTRKAVTPSEIRAEKNMKNIFCLNNGEYNPVAGKCICKVGYRGLRCETHECHNYCLHGTCTILPMGKANCTCQEGFQGERCDIYKCNEYCINNGECTIVDDQPKCKCLKGFNGERCENNSTEICLLLCQLKKYDQDIELPFGCSNYCDDDKIYEKSSLIYIKNVNEESTTTNTNIYERNIEICSNTYNKTIIFVMLGVVIALLLVFLIVIALRKIYKPARPRIKKTFVVQKKMSQTPLTSRPMATEQCEITIENCCNMNICDTPCFDPKLLQQNMSFDSCTKDDKKMLIDNEDDLY